MPGERPPAVAPLGHLDLVKALATLFAGMLFSLNCYLSPGFPAVLLPFIEGSSSAFVWGGPAGVLLGVGFSLLGRGVKDGKSGAGSRLPVILVVGFLASVFMLVAAPLETAQFFLMLIFLFPCVIFVYGAMNGRLWAVVSGALLQLFIGFGTGLDGQEISALLAYALVYLAALELSWSSAAQTASLESGLAEATGDRGRLWARRTADRLAGAFLSRLVACGAAAALSVAVALAVFANPGLFGPAYAESFEAYTIAGLLLPGTGMLAALALGLLVPHDIAARSRSFLARSRLRARSLVLPVRPRPDGDGPGKIRNLRSRS